MLSRPMQASEHKRLYSAQYNRWFWCWFVMVIAALKACLRHLKGASAGWQGYVPAANRAEVTNTLTSMAALRLRCQLLESALEQRNSSQVITPTSGLAWGQDQLLGQSCVWAQQPQHTVNSDATATQLGSWPQHHGDAQATRAGLALQPAMSSLRFLNPGLVAHEAMLRNNEAPKSYKSGQGKAGDATRHCFSMT